MAQVLIRNVQDATVENYRQKAKIKGISLEQELRDLLEANRSFTPDERVTVSRAIRARQTKMSEPLSLEEIRDGLE